MILWFCNSILFLNVIRRNTHLYLPQQKKYEEEKLCSLICIPWNCKIYFHSSFSFFLFFFSPFTQKIQISTFWNSVLSNRTTKQRWWGAVQEFFSWGCAKAQKTDSKSLTWKIQTKEIQLSQSRLVLGSVPSILSCPRLCPTAASLEVPGLSHLDRHQLSLPITGRGTSPCFSYKLCIIYGAFSSHRSCLLGSSPPQLSIYNGNKTNAPIVPKT